MIPYFGKKKTWNITEKKKKNLNSSFERKKEKEGKNREKSNRERQRRRDDELYGKCRGSHRGGSGDPTLSSLISIGSQANRLTNKAI